ncbi:class I SAM-dependent methyltransferase [Longirhabdus pacifica]|uniref:class I SAM-dependent methyltransferase n=1 Tax=Longirhabdus pacifica TaxID=2305227 RepID=UPI001008ACF7|nr:class I SAM-dependent methyltransferase [Longirhabdus pacifica]
MENWYKRSFGEDYLEVYKHRNVQGAYQEIQNMMGWLHLPKGATILDLCCGMGRHALALHHFGYKVTGIDLSEVLLDEARKLDVNHDVEWVHGDMRQVPIRKQFDVVVNLFTSFGYFTEDEENMKVLLEIQRLLKYNGTFVIDFLNPQYVKENLVAASERKQSDMTILEERRIQDEAVHKVITILKSDQIKKQYNEHVKLYSLAQFENMFEKTDLKLSNVYGDYDKSPYDQHVSKRMIMVGKKLKRQ